MCSHHRLSHAMFRVPSVVDSVNYWVTHVNGTMGRHSRNDAGELKGAFVSIPLSEETSNSGTANDSSDATVLDRPSFALELTSSKGQYHVGNCLEGIAVPRLAHERNIPALDPNGIPHIASSTNAVCLVLRTNLPLDKVKAFYTSVLGMTVVPSLGDHSTTLKSPKEHTGSESENVSSSLCLCYPGDKKDDLSKTMLVFVPSAIPIELGNCFDHFVIEIDEAQTSIADEYTRITAAMEDARDSGLTGGVLMKPTTMFGADIMGVHDPSGYKVFLATPAKPV